MCALMNLYIRYHYWLSFILNECTDCFNKVFFPTATTQLILEVSRKIAAELSSQRSVQYIMFFFDLLFSRVISCKSWHCVLKERWCEHVFVRECSCIHVWVWERVCVCVCVCVCVNEKAITRSPLNGFPSSGDRWSVRLNSAKWKSVVDLYSVLGVCIPKSWQVGPSVK